LPTVLLDLSILATETRVRGIGRYARELGLGLAALGSHEPITLRYLERIGYDGSVTVSDDAAATIARLARSALVNPFSWAYRLRLGLGRAARRAGAQVVHLPHASATPLFALPARRILTCHDLIPWHYPDRYVGWTQGFAPGRRWLDRRRYRSADHLIAISHATAADLTRFLGIAPSRISVIHHGIDAERWSSTPAPDDAEHCRRHGLEPGRYLVYAGDADWRKNASGMLAALGEVRRAGLPLSLAWAGKLGAARRRQLLADADRAGVPNALRLLGFVPDRELRALYRSALGTLFVSRAEGFGLPVLESMAMGTPVITSDRSSLSEIGAGAALLVDPERPDAIAAAILRLAREPALREALRDAGLARARQLSLRAEVERTLAVYGLLL
jgi:glycosyltransferase involved in cell wall biosynthesis